MTTPSRITPQSRRDPDGIDRDLLVDMAESPLAWLASRRDRKGEAMISPDEFLAGERFRQDFTIGGLVARTTMNWDSLGAGSDRRGGGSGGLILSEAALAARQRVNAALVAVGPEFGNILVDVCCHLKGLSDVERAHDWPLRSAKVVLRLALAALARHYHLGAHATGPASTDGRHWGSPDYRPAI